MDKPEPTTSKRLRDQKMYDIREVKVRSNNYSEYVRSITMPNRGASKETPP